MRCAETQASEVDEQDALCRARESLRTLIEVSPELIVVHREGQVLYANHAVVRALGFARADEITGTELPSLFHIDDREAVMARLVHPPPGAPGAPIGPSAPSATRETFGVRWRCKDGSYRSTEALAAPIDFEEQGAVLVIAREVTARMDVQHQLWQRERMAALGTLSAGVAHEINNPLTYLLVNLEHVLRRLRAASASDDPIAELSSGSGRGPLHALVQSLQQAVDGANRVRQIVRDLLTFSQGNVDEQGLTDVRGLVESAMQMAWHEIRHRARLVKSLAEVPPVDANQAQLGQVFLNLIVNAAQAIPEGHADRNEIRVTTRTDERGDAVIEVSDTGSGIAAEDLPRVFDPFFTTKGERGTGLGLAMSHGTVKALGGEICVTSNPGQGTTFRVCLPPGEFWRRPPASSSSRGAGTLRRPRVLVIDDERLVGDAIARALSDDNDVEVVTDARVPLGRIAAGQAYDIILCDLLMPVMTGMDFYAEVVRTAPRLAGRIVFMTGGAFTARARAFVESVANQCLEKPPDMARLRSLLALVSRE
jgi:PAS domain S-box-containing protein